MLALTFVISPSVCEREWMWSLLCPINSSVADSLIDALHWAPFRLKIHSQQLTSIASIFLKTNVSMSYQLSLTFFCCSELHFQEVMVDFCLANSEDHWIYTGWWGWGSYFLVNSFEFFSFFCQIFLANFRKWNAMRHTITNCCKPMTDIALWHKALIITIIGGDRSFLTVMNIHSAHMYGGITIKR